jgi:hypothetical protein
LARKQCVARGGVYATYVCQQRYFDCLRELPDAVTFVVRGARKPSDCERAQIEPPKRCATEEY